jgi:hypothetical protein
MARQFKPARFFVMVGAAVFVVCEWTTITGVVANARTESLENARVPQILFESLPERREASGDIRYASIRWSRFAMSKIATRNSFFLKRGTHSN